MLRRRGEGRDLVAAERDEHAPRRLAERRHRRGRIGHKRPAVAGLLPPGRPAQGDERQTGRRSRRDGIGADAGGIGMGGIDQQATPWARR